MCKKCHIWPITFLPPSPSSEANNLDKAKKGVFSIEAILHSAGVQPCQQDIHI